MIFFKEYEVRGWLKVLWGFIALQYDGRVMYKQSHSTVWPLGLEPTAADATRTWNRRRTVFRKEGVFTVSIKDERIYKYKQTTFKLLDRG